MRFMKRGILILSLVILSLVILSLGACQSASPADLPETTPTEMEEITAPTEVEPDNAPMENMPPQPEASATPLVIDFPLPIPEGQPSTEWKNIPIMPEAIQGAAMDNGTYAFTIAVSPAEIQAHYEMIMPGKGYEHVITSVAQDGTTIMIFKVDDRNIKVAAFYLIDDLAYVLLTP